MHLVDGMIDLFGRIMLTYPAWAGWIMLIVAAGALGLSAREQPDLRALGSGAGRMAGLLLVAWLTLQPECCKPILA